MKYIIIFVGIIFFSIIGFDISSQAGIIPTYTAEASIIKKYTNVICNPKNGCNNYYYVEFSSSDISNQNRNKISGTYNKPVSYVKWKSYNIGEKFKVTYSKLPFINEVEYINEIKE